MREQKETDGIVGATRFNMANIAYLAGSITNNKKYLYDFADAEFVFKHMGYLVLSPIHIPYGLEWEDYMRIDEVLLDIADTVVFLDGWKRSKGAKMEHEWAKEKNKNIIYYKRREIIV